MRTFHFRGGIIYALLTTLLTAANASGADFLNSDTPNLPNRITPETYATVVKRVRPLFPLPIRNSGFCCIEMEVNEQGQAEHIRTPFCTEDKFAATSINSVKQWKFSPALIAGTPVRAYGLSTIITYRIVDETGRLIPDLEGLMGTDVEDPRAYEQICEPGPSG